MIAIVGRLVQGWRRLRTGPPVPPVPPLSEMIPQAPLHDPVAHEIAGKLTAVRMRAKLIDHEAFTRAEARAITIVPEAPDPTLRRSWERTEEIEREQGRDARGGGGYLCESLSPF